MKPHGELTYRAKVKVHARRPFGRLTATNVLLTEIKDVLTRSINARRPNSRDLLIQQRINIEAIRRSSK